MTVGHWIIPINKDQRWRFIGVIALREKTIGGIMEFPMRWHRIGDLRYAMVYKIPGRKSDAMFQGPWDHDIDQRQKKNRESTIRDRLMRWCDRGKLMRWRDRGKPMRWCDRAITIGGFKWTQSEEPLQKFLMLSGHRNRRGGNINFGAHFAGLWVI